jgi:hypothetical protein
MAISSPIQAAWIVDNFWSIISVWIASLQPIWLCFVRSLNWYQKRQN